MLEQQIQTETTGTGRGVYPALDGLRALACLNLLCLHVYVHSAVKPSASWFITNSREVFLFMMVSAFSLSCGYFHRFQSRTVSLTTFYERRYRRILPFFALLVLVDVLHTFVAEGFSLTEAVRGSLCQAYADLTLAFGFFVETYTDIEVVGVGWFLGVIFMFYMIYPFFTFLIRTKKSAVVSFLLALGLYFTVAHYFVPVKGTSFDKSNMVFCMPYFLAGGVIFRCREAIASWARRSVGGVSCRHLLLAAALAYTAFFFALPHLRVELLSDLLLFTLYIMYAVAEAAGPVTRQTFLSNRLMHFLSGVSLEVYLCHMAVFRVVEKLDLGSVIADRDALFWTDFLLVAAGSVAVAVLWKRVERRFINPR